MKGALQSGERELGFNPSSFKMSSSLFGCSAVEKKLTTCHSKKLLDVSACWTLVLKGPFAPDIDKK